MHTSQVGHTHLFNRIIFVSPLEKCRACKIGSRIRLDIFDRIPVDIGIFWIRSRKVFVTEKHLRVPSSIGLDAFNPRLPYIFPGSTN